MPVVLSTADVPPRDQFDYWQDMLARQAMPIAVQTDRVRFSARIHAADFGVVRTLLTENTPVEIQRTPALIRRSDPESYYLIFNRRGRVVMSQERRSAVAGAVLVGESAPALMWDSAGVSMLEGDVPARAPVGSVVAPDLLSSAAGAGPAARVAEVGTALTAGGDLVLRPDVSMLTSAEVQLPIYVDPPWSTGMDKWAYARNIDSNYTVNGQAWVGKNPPCCGGDGSLFRSYFEFPTGALAGKYIHSAYVQMVLDHSYSCGDSETNMYWTTGITPNSSPRVAWAPGHYQWLDYQVSHANETGGNCGAVQPDQTVNFGFHYPHTTNAIQTHADNWWATITIGFCACIADGSYESNQDRWKRWLPGARQAHRRL